MARRNNPYVVVPMKYWDFSDLKRMTSENCKPMKFDQEGKRVNWLKIKWIRVTKEQPDCIQIKTDWDSDFQIVKALQQARGRAQSMVPKTKYEGKIAISEAKKKDLLSLCNTLVIPPAYHTFYDQLKATNSLKDKLPQPDATEEIE